MNFFANAAFLVSTVPVSATKIISTYNDFADQHFMLICGAAAAIGAILYFSVTGVGANLKKAKRRDVAPMDVPRGEVKRESPSLPRPASKLR